jgi:hypothetical protein
MSTLVQTIAGTIATQEGADVPGSLAQKNNNPGNLVYAPWEAAYGATQGQGGFASFPSVSSGEAAVEYRVGQLVNEGDSISQIVDTWAGTQYGNSQASVDSYVANLTSATGISADTPLNSSDAQTLYNGLPDIGSASGGVQQSLQGLPGTATAGTATAGTASGGGWSALLAALNPENIVIAVIGVACLAGGLLMLKTTQVVISKTARLAE